MTFEPNIRQIAVGRPRAHRRRCTQKQTTCPVANRARRLKKNESHGHLRAQDVPVLSNPNNRHHNIVVHPYNNNNYVYIINTWRPITMIHVLLLRTG